MILLVDAGNTRLKWRLHDTGLAIIGEGAVPDGGAAGVGAMPAVDPEVILVASVRAERDQDLLAGTLSERYPGAQVAFARAEAAWDGLVNGYEQPARLGVDRWLAMVGAWALGVRDFLVVDAGTALTIDAVAAGSHRGGYILPGLAMQRRLLAANTARVGLGEGPPDLAPGRTTAAAVANGTLLGAACAVTQAFVELRATAGDTCRLFVTGGDAGLLASVMREPVEHRPGLVLDGLLAQWRSGRPRSPGN